MQNPDEVDWDNYWNPKIYVENNLGEPKETVWQTLLMNGKGEATIYERRRVKGCFLENLELGEFPFDTQVEHVDVIFQFAYYVLEALNWKDLDYSVFDFRRT